MLFEPLVLLSLLCVCAFCAFCAFLWLKLEWFFQDLAGLLEN